MSETSAHIPEEAREQKRLIKTMKRRGGRGFRVLRSAETGLRVYVQRGRVTAARRTRNGSTDECVDAPDDRLYKQRSRDEANQTKEH